MTSDYKELLSILNAHRVKRYDARRFPEPGPFFRMGHEPVGVDLLTTIPGIDFDSAWARKVEAVFDDETNLRVHVISREDLITAKRAAGRPQDLADISAIEKAPKAGRPW